MCLLWNLYKPKLPSCEKRCGPWKVSIKKLLRWCPRNSCADIIVNHNYQPNLQKCTFLMQFYPIIMLLSIALSINIIWLHLILVWSEQLFAGMYVSVYKRKFSWIAGHRGEVLSHRVESSVRFQFTQYNRDTVIGIYSCMNSLLGNLESVLRSLAKLSIWNLAELST